MGRGGLVLTTRIGQPPNAVWEAGNEFRAAGLVVDGNLPYEVEARERMRSTSR